MSACDPDHLSPCLAPMPCPSPHVTIAVRTHEPHVPWVPSGAAAARFEPRLPASCAPLALRPAACPCSLESTSLRTLRGAAVAVPSIAIPDSCPNPRGGRDLESDGISGKRADGAAAAAAAAAATSTARLLRINRSRGRPHSAAAFVNALMPH
eukprot:356731-Chlamydomonas_euryale.AAC.10